MNIIMCIGACFDAVVNIYIIILFSHISVIMEVNLRMEVTLYKAKSMLISSPGEG